MMLSRWRSSSSATCVSQKRERLRKKNVSLIKRGNVWHFAFRWNGKRYRGTCKTSKEQEAKKVESLVLARLLRRKRSRAISPVTRFPSSGWKPSGQQVFPDRSCCTVRAIASQPTRWREQET